MPLGVEHMGTRLDVRPAEVVPLPLMPLGVEHCLGYFGHPLIDVSAFTFDATRR